jgi:hypothetical protein
MQRPQIPEEQEDSLIDYGGEYMQIAANKRKAGGKNSYFFLLKTS